MKDREITEDYVRKLTAGDQEVENHFVLHFGALMRIKLRSKLRSSQMIEDISQETFLRVLRTLRKGPGLTKPERLAAFVNSVCTHVMLESFRADTKHRPMPEDAPDPPDENADPSRGLAREEQEIAVRSLLAELPPKDRELLRRVFFEERDKVRMCAEMHVSPEYFRVLFHRAKGRFRALLEKDGKDAAGDGTYSS